MRQGALAGLRVLVVEDEFLVSLLIEDLLADQGCTILGPFDRLALALAAAETQSFDLAVLDVNLAGEKVYPVAELLESRQIPFLLLSGYGANAIPLLHPSWSVCSKPFREDDLIGMLTQLIVQVRGG